MKNNRGKMMLAAAAVTAAAIGLSACAAPAAAPVQIPDTIKVQSVDSAYNQVTASGKEE